MAVKTEVNERIRVPAWFGTIDDLKQLARTIEDWFEAERAAAKRALPPPSPKYSDFSRKRFESDWTLTATAKNKLGHSKTGPLAELLETGDAADLTEISFTYPGVTSAATSKVRFSIDVTGGLVVDVTSDNQFRIKAFEAVILAETKQNNPWWTWPLTTAWGVIVEYLVLAGFFWGFAQLLARQIHNVVAHSAVLIVGASVGPLLFWATRWKRVAPLFQVLSTPDQSPSAYKLLRGLAAGLLGPILVGLIVAYAAK